MTKTVLIVVDVQNDFITGILRVSGADHIAWMIPRMIQRPRNLFHMKDNLSFDYVVSTQDWHIAPGKHWSSEPDFKTTWPEHCRAETWGALLHQELSSVKFDAQFYKGRFSAAYSGFEGYLADGPITTLPVASQGLPSWLRKNKVTRVAVCGLTLDHCVKMTALDAVKQGFETILLQSFTTPMSFTSGKCALKELSAAGVKIV